MHPSRPIVLIGVGFAATSMLLPFASLPVFGSVNGISSDAWPALIPLVPVTFLTVAGPSGAGPGVAKGLTAVGLGASSLVFSLVKVADAVVATRDTPGATTGPGSWVLAAAVAFATGGAAYAALSRS